MITLAQGAMLGALVGVTLLVDAALFWMLWAEKH